MPENKWIKGRRPPVNYFDPYGEIEAWGSAIESDHLPALNSCVEVKMFGEPETYIGVCVRPRKLWVEIPNFIIADENNIVCWRNVTPTALEIDREIYA